MHACVAVLQNGSLMFIIIKLQPEPWQNTISFLLRRLDLLGICNFSVNIRRQSCEYLYIIIDVCTCIVQPNVQKLQLSFNEPYYYDDIVIQCESYKRNGMHSNIACKLSSSKRAERLLFCCYSVYKQYLFVLRTQ